MRVRLAHERGRASDSAWSASRFIRLGRRASLVLRDDAADPTETEASGS
jgi:hypothetical protein